MVFAAIFAGGKGSRMGHSDTPKQYLELGSKPVIIHTIEKFFVNDRIDKIIVLCPKPWVAHTKDLVKKATTGQRTNTERLAHRIISENVDAAIKYGACDTVIPATDTIVRSEDNALISEIPDRKKMYQGQTPQSFRLNELKRVIGSLTEEEKAILTDACKIFTIKNKPVYMVEGEVFNFKITFPYDMKVADTLMKGKDAE